MKILRGDIILLECKIAGRLKKRRKYKLLEKKYNVRRKGIRVVVEELKQRLRAKSVKIKRYDQRVKQYQQNSIFMTHQRRFYQLLNGDFSKEKVVPDVAESVGFWRSLWDCDKVHNRDAGWLRRIYILRGRIM